eukprot:2611262-Rhodomonas_salina.5
MTHMRTHIHPPFGHTFVAREAVDAQKDARGAVLVGGSDGLDLPQIGVRERRRQHCSELRGLDLNRSVCTATYPDVCTTTGCIVGGSLHKLAVRKGEVRGRCLDDFAAVRVGEDSVV